MFPTLVSAQFLSQDFDSINKINEKKAKEFLTRCQSKNAFSRIINSIKNKKTEIKSVAFYNLTSRVSEYNENSKIIDFLELSTKKTIDDFLAFKTIKGDKLIFDCGFTLFIENNKHYTFEGMKKIEFSDSTTITLLNSGVWHKVLSNKSPDFIFTVDGFQNTVWFLKDNIVKLVDLKDLKIYNPDDYIKNNCSIEKIKKLDQNSNNKFCE